MCQFLLNALREVKIAHSRVVLGLFGVIMCVTGSVSYKNISLPEVPDT